jgi:hypothetical protein
VGQEVDVVTGPRGQRGQQQRGVHRPIQPGPSAGISGGGIHPDATGRRAAGIEHDDHSAIPLRAPRPHHHVCTPCGRAPIDRADVVTDDVFAQRIEFGALPPDQNRGHALELTQLGQPGRQMLA